MWDEMLATMLPASLCLSIESCHASRAVCGHVSAYAIEEAGGRRCWESAVTDGVGTVWCRQVKPCHVACVCVRLGVPSCLF
jgi:hypothetical protein